jgi:YgiT-type zinc finger domain-containing protein
MGERLHAEETQVMCQICAGQLRPTQSDVPFNLDASHIVIFKALPIQQCDQCGQYFIDDLVMERVEALLARADAATELEVVRYAA